MVINLGREEGKVNRSQLQGKGGKGEVIEQGGQMPLSAKKKGGVHCSEMGLATSCTMLKAHKQPTMFLVFKLAGHFGVLKSQKNLTV